MNIIKYIKFFLILALSLNSVSYGQGFKKVGGGFKHKIHLLTHDPDGNLYTFSTNSSGDSLLFHKYTFSTKQWSEITRVKSIYSSDPNFVEFVVFFVLNGEIYCSNIDDFDYKIVKRFRNNAWQTAFTTDNKIDNEFFHYWGSNKVIFRSYAYPITKVNGTNVNGVFAYDGNKVMDLNAQNVGIYVYPYKDSVFSTLNTSDFSIWARDSSSLSSYSSYVPVGKYVWWMVFTETAKYLITSGDSILQFDRSKIIRPGTKLQANRFYGFKNNIYYKNERIVPTNNVTLYKMDKNYWNSVVFSIPKNDSLNRFIATSKGMYYYSYFNINHSGNDYGTIVELNVDTSINLDTVVVRTFHDKNSNYKYDSGEEIGQISLDINKHSGSVTDQNGIFTFYVSESDSTEVKVSDYGCYFQVFSGYLRPKTYNSPITRDTLFFPLNKYNTQNLRAFIYGSGRARPNVPTSIGAAIHLKGCNYNPNSYKVEIKLENNTELIKSTPNYTSRNGNTLIYEFNSVYVNDDKFISLDLKYPIAYFNFDDKPKHTIRVYDYTRDDFSKDNQDTFIQFISNSFDPNEKTSIPSGRTTENLKKVRYNIQFQNEGNDLAYKVVVEDSLFLNMPVYAFQMVYATHPYKVILTPSQNLVTWVFDDINLEPKSKDVAKSMGYLVFDAYLNTNLRVGDSILNKAFIYFDYNSPIITPNAMVKRVDNASSITRIGNLNIKIYPNPSNTFCTVENYENDLNSIDIYTIEGRIIKSVELEQGLNQIDLNGFSPGVYFLMCEINGNSYRIKYIVN